jgi:pimeloyl-ACP methyl ester carboxylesterase
MDIESYFKDPRFCANIFFPQKSIPKNLHPNRKNLYLAISSSNGDSITIGGIFHLQNSQFPTLLLFHGNGETAELYDHFVDFYFSLQVNFAIVDYRGYGFSTGVPTYHDLIMDSVPIYNTFIKWLNQHQIVPNIFLMGRSLGSACVAEIGSHNPCEVKGIIFESGFADTLLLMKELFMIDLPKEIPTSILNVYSNIPKIIKIRKPSLIIHGDRDEIIPVSEGLAIYDLLPKSTLKEKRIISHAGHNDIITFAAEYYSAIQDFLTKYR